RSHAKVFREWDAVERVRSIRRSHFMRIGLFVLLLAASTSFAATNAFPTYKLPVMTWVPPYAVAKSKARLIESFGGLGVKDALTHLGLQFWQPTKDGGLKYAGRTNDVNDAAVSEMQKWG